jgi:phosphoglycerate dehydrogenase-like enzyme
VTRVPPKVVLTEHLDDACAEWLARRVELVRQSHEDAEALRAELADAEGLVVRTYTQVDAGLLQHAPQLKVVARAGVGLDNISLPDCTAAGVRVVYTPDANTQAVVEYLWGLILDVVRPRAYLTDYVPPPKFHELRQIHVGKQLSTMTLGILGMGRIGRRVAECARAIGMRVLYNDLLTRRELNLPEDDTSEFVDKHTLYEQSDILTIHTDGRAENRHLIDAKSLARLKPSCLLINAARGMLIDNNALAAWADAVRDSGGVAVLDVHDPEPPDDAYPLFGHPNVKLLPHLASRTPEAMENMSWVVKDVVKVLEGEEPTYPAN